MDAIGKLLESLGFAAPLLYAGAAYGLFHWLDENLSVAAKAALASTMKLKEYRKEQVASALVEIFDRIYTRPLLSWGAFGRSLNFTWSFFAIFLLESLYLKQIPGLTLLVFGNPKFFLVALVFNVCTDYLSLFAIRSMLIRSGTKPVTSLALAGLSGAAIVLLSNLIRGLLIFRMSAGSNYLADASLQFMWPAIIVFIWLPLFALGILIIRALTPLSWIVAKAQWALKEGDKHPLKAIGCVAAVVIFAVTVGLRAIFAA
jgi:hypothetical protein